MATAIGRSCEINLAFENYADVHPGAEICRGAQSRVLHGTMTLPSDAPVKPDGAGAVPVAIKKAVMASSEDLERYRIELKAMASLSHPNVLRLLGAQALPPNYTLVLEFAAGGSLENALHAAGWRPGPRDAVSVALQLARALAHVHAAGLVHRDVKPANVLLSEPRDSRGSGAPEVKLTDFGLAESAEKLAREAADLTSRLKAGMPSGGFHKKHMVGTLQYMAPEVLMKSGPHSPAADMYAWAVVANEVLSGVVPFSDCTKENPAAHTVLEMGYGQQELAAAVCGEGLRPLPAASTPPALQALLDRCWVADPAQRPAAAEVVATLEELLERLPADHRASTEHEEAMTLPGESSQGASVTEAAAEGEAARAVAPAGPWPAAPWAEGPADGAVRMGLFTTAGKREKMEDAGTVVSPLGGLAGVHMMAVFDGHRGAYAAERAAADIEAYLHRSWTAPTAEECLRRAFVALDASICSDLARQHAEKVACMGAPAAGPKACPGCTAMAVLVAGPRVYVANAGDCRAVLCRGGRAVAISRDHSTQSEAERERITACGGKLEWLVDGWRVGAPGLQVTRSLGDPDAKPDGVTAVPEVTSTALEASDEFVIAASDGLWEVLTNEEAVGIVRDTVRDPGMCGRRLAMEAVSRGSGDNVSVAVAFLGGAAAGGTAHQVFDETRGELHPVQATPAGSRGVATGAAGGNNMAADEVMDFCY
ncbi:unnamed protein product [Pedinophyceae sp. YPF-701]|nr:unnamed protein product [Pedinophyceae sp. YPF-701]